MSTKRRRLLLWGSLVVVLIAAFGVDRHRGGQPADSSVVVSMEKVDINTGGISTPKFSPVVETSASSIPAVSTSKDPQITAASEKARIAPVINWSKYPGTLDSQVNRALGARDGSMAMDLANKLLECEVELLSQGNPVSRSGEVEASLGAQAEKVKQAHKSQRIISNCQTISGGTKEMRSRLLDLALEMGEAGAAVEIFLSGVQRPEVLRALVSDASAGDLKSLIYVAAHKPSFFSVDSSTQGAARWALEIAANDATVGHLARPYFEIAESLSVPLGGEARSKFDFSGLSAESRAQGQLIASKLIEKVRARKE